MSGDNLKAAVERLRGILTRLGRVRSFRDPLAHMVEMDLSPAQFHLLMWLGTDGQLPMGVLAQRIGTTLPACTRNIDRLYSLGLVQRERDPSDRRVVLVRLSADGARLHEQFEGHLRAKLGAVLGAVDNDDREKLLTILERLEKNLTTAAPPAGDLEKVS